MSHPLAIALTIGLLAVLTACSRSPGKIDADVTQVVVSEGQAEIGPGGLLLARRQALQDAIRQAALTQQSYIESRTELTDQAILFDRFTLRTAAAVNSATVLEEKRQDNLLYLKARIALGALQGCPSFYRKRLVATAFPLAYAGHVSAAESSDLSRGLARELLNRLMESGRFIGINRSHLVIHSQTDSAPEPLDYPLDQVSAVRQVAQDSQAQLVLSGVIRDMQIEPNMRITGSDPISQAQSITRKLWRARGITVDVYLHDGFTGALLSQFRYQDRIHGDIWLPERYPVGSENFREHPVGEALNQIIARAAGDIDRAMRCYPFSARILKIEPPDTIFIDAGAQEGLRSGDQLVVYSGQSGDLYLNNQREYLGPDPQPVTVVTLNDVKPRYARGHLDSASYPLNLKPGDWVRAW